MREFIRDTIEAWRVTKHDIDDLYEVPYIGLVAALIALPILLAGALTQAIARFALPIVGSLVMLAVVPVFGPLVVVKMRRRAFVAERASAEWYERWQLERDRAKPPGFDVVPKSPKGT